MLFAAPTAKKETKIQITGRFKDSVLEYDMVIYKGKRNIDPTLRSNDDILMYLRELTKKLGSDTISTSDINADGKISVATIHRKFGSLSQALVKAGLRPKRTQKRDTTDMLAQLKELVAALGRTPSKKEIKANLSYSARAYETDFQSIGNAVAKAQAIDGVDSAASYTKIDAILHKPLLPAKRRKYGPTLDFRGLRHAPINELGVVFLFGMLAEELGYIVESIQNGFPDCDAKKRLPSGEYERVRIEFEYESKNFLSHNHNVKECDTIVCWIHNWPQCPIEVLELSRMIGANPPQDLYCR